jgi:hypothetical protein
VLATWLAFLPFIFFLLLFFIFFPGLELQGKRVST